VIVVDVGCASYGFPWSSLRRLRRRFSPDEMFGIDPMAKPSRIATVIPKAAWLFDGEIGYIRNGTSSMISSDLHDPVECLDLARFIGDLRPPVVLKLDCEGAEYDLLSHLIAEGVDDRLLLALVEWHGSDERRTAIEYRLACPIEEWIW